MVFCNTAIVNESIGLDRLNHKYLIRIAIRSGETYNINQSLNRSISLMLINLIRSFIKVVVGILISILLLPFSLMNFQIKTALNIGKIKSILRLSPVRPYKF